MGEPLDVSSNHSKSAKVAASVCLLAIHLIFCIDNGGINGVVPLIQAAFSIGDSQTAIIGTAASITHTVVLGLVWIFGDSFQRSKLFLTSVSLWITFSLLSIILGSGSFTVFVVFRSLSTAASSLYEVLVQVMFADLFDDRALGIAIMCMTATDILSGYIINIISSFIVSNNFPWQSALIAAPLVAIPPVIALICVKNIFRSVKHVRGIAKTFTHALGIFSIKSYLLIVGSMTFGLFFKKGAMFWSPSFFLAAWEYNPKPFFGLSYTPIITLNSSMSMAGALIGMPVILWLAQSWYHGTGPLSCSNGFNRAYPVVVAIGTAVTVCAYVASVLLVESSYVICLIATFIKGFCLGVSSLNQQMVLMVVPPASRAAAVALSRLVISLVSSPAGQLIGMVSDAVRGDSTLPYDKFHGYQIAQLFASSFSIIGGLFTLVLIVFFPGDCERADEDGKEELEEVENERTALLGASRKGSK